MQIHTAVALAATKIPFEIIKVRLHKNCGLILTVTFEDEIGGFIVVYLLEEDIDKIDFADMFMKSQKDFRSWSSTQWPG